MSHIKFYLLNLFLLIVSIELFPQSFSFTWYGPTSVSLPYNQSSVNASYSFIYYREGLLIRPRLIIYLDGNMLNQDGLCQGNEAFTPSSFNISFTVGHHNVRFELYDEICQYAHLWQVAEFDVNCSFTIRIENKDFSGGIVKVDNVNRSAPFDKSAQQGAVISLGALDQSAGGFNWIWNASGTNNSQWWRQLWQQNPTYYSYNRNTSYTAQSNDKDTKLLAGLKKVLNNVIFQNSFAGVGNGGVIKVNGTQYNSPKTADGVVELNPVTGETVTQTINGIRYNLGHWSDGSTFPMKTFYPASNTTYTAYYIGRPSNANRNLHNNIAYGQPITLIWNENPNTNVTQYQIWRKVKHNGVVSEPVLLATKNRGTLTYTDNEYSLTNGYTDDLLWYDVRGYYTVENTYADAEWLAIYGEIIPKQSDSLSTTEKLTEFSVSSFPNPFNPSTKIQVILPFDDHLQVTIFNSIGERIIELRNENVAKGRYEIIWNGKDSRSMMVNSGIYFVVVKTETKMTTQKLVLLK